MITFLGLGLFFVYLFLALSAKALHERSYGFTRAILVLVLWAGYQGYSSFWSLFTLYGVSVVFAGWIQRWEIQSDDVA